MTPTPSGNRPLSADGLRQVCAQLKLVVFDFDGVFTDNSVYVLDNGQEMVRCSRFDGFGLRMLAKCGLDSMIVSTEANPVVSHRAKKLKILCHQAIEDKETFLSAFLADRKLDWSQICYVGNDINDIDCLKRAGLSVVVNDSHPSVFSHSQLTTKTNGGFGAVREICEFLFEKRGALA